MPCTKDIHPYICGLPWKAHFQHTKALKMLRRYTMQCGNKILRAQIMCVRNLQSVNLCLFLRVVKVPRLLVATLHSISVIYLSKPRPTFRRRYIVPLTPFGGTPYIVSGSHVLHCPSSGKVRKLNNLILFETIPIGNATISFSNMIHWCSKKQQRYIDLGPVVVSTYIVGYLDPNIL